MKTVSAKVISTTSISLSKAASILSKFASANNGTSQAIGAYIRRASIAFNELTLHHKELKSPSKSQRKHIRSSSDVIQENNPTRSIGANEELSQLAELSQGRIHGVGDSIERRKQKKERGKGRGEIGNIVENEGESAGVKIEIKSGEKPSQLGKERNHRVEANVGMERERNKHKKNKEKDTGEYSGNFEENGGQIGKIEDEAKMEIEYVKEEWKKRKSEGLQEGGEVGSEERQSKKKKRRKSEGDS